MINITDTARTLYKNAKLRAWSFANPTTRIKFYNSQGVDLGYELSTNADGYIIYGSSQLRANGYFVGEQAVIQVSLDGGTTFPVEWVTESTEIEVFDGALYNKNSAKVWSANASYPYTLNYNDLKNTPTFQTWMEQQLAASLAATIAIPEFVTLLILNAGTGHEPKLTFSRAAQQVVIWNQAGIVLDLYDVYGIKVATLTASEKTLISSYKDANGGYSYHKLDTRGVDYVAYAYSQSLTAAQQLQARENIGIETAAEIFTATYNSTKYSEIETAYQAGKALCAKGHPGKTQALLPCFSRVNSGVADTTSYFVFTAYVGFESIIYAYRLICYGDDTWAHLTPDVPNLSEALIKTESVPLTVSRIRNVLKQLGISGTIHVGAPSDTVGEANVTATVTLGDAVILIAQGRGSSSGYGAILAKQVSGTIQYKFSGLTTTDLALTSTYQDVGLASDYWSRCVKLTASDNSGECLIQLNAGIASTRQSIGGIITSVAGLVD